MRIYVLGATHQQAVDWTRNQGWDRAADVHTPMGAEDPFFRGQENFIVILVGTFWNRPDCAEVYNLIRTRPGAFVTSRADT